MTPKEKAEQLITEYSNEVFIVFDVSRLDSKIARHKGTLVLESAKRCALMAVDKVINASPHKWVPFMNQYTETVLVSDVGYWLEVKQEIEKL
jgi:glycerol-3-phosphate cytidylyltransferase-like family protein